MALIGMLLHLLPLLGFYIYLILLFRKQYTNQQKQLYGSFFDKTPLSQGFNTLVSYSNNVVYIFAKVMIIASIVDNRSTLNYIFYITSIVLLVTNSVYQYIDHQKAFPSTKNQK